MIEMSEVMKNGDNDALFNSHEVERNKLLNITSPSQETFKLFSPRGNSQLVKKKESAHEASRINQLLLKYSKVKKEQMTSEER